jgi:hypothetical protein
MHSINRHIPCTLTATVTRRDDRVLQVSFDLALPALGFVLNTRCMIDAGVLAGSPIPEEALFQVGKEGMAQVLKILRSGSVHADNHAYPEPGSVHDLGSAHDPRALAALPRPEPLPVAFTQSDREALRAFGIQG